VAGGLRCKCLLDPMTRIIFPPYARCVVLFIIDPYSLWFLRPLEDGRSRPGSPFSSLHSETVHAFILHHLPRLKGISVHQCIMPIPSPTFSRRKSAQNLYFELFLRAVLQAQRSRVPPVLALLMMLLALSFYYRCPSLSLSNFLR